MSRSKRRGLVLGGGGPVGVAWEMGLALGLREAGVDLARADRIVGTSAGSLVGARLAAGHDLSGIAPRFAAALPMPDGGLDRASLAAAFGPWNEAIRPEQMDAARRRQIGAAALAARTASPEAWAAAIDGLTGLAGWPEVDLRVTAVDIESGELCCFDRMSGVPLAGALAASCCVPGMFPPVEINARFYMDGGIGSGTHADRIGAEEDDFQIIVVIAPMTDTTVPVGTCAERFLEQESEALRRACGDVVVVTPDDDDVAAFGAELMNPIRTQAAFERGHQRAAELARGSLRGWNG